MAAAAWTEHARDITTDRAAWDKYMNAEQVSDYIVRQGYKLAPATVIDIINRNPAQDDPRRWLYQPAARLGRTRLAAVPMWSYDQVDHYIAAQHELAERTGTPGRDTTPKRVYTTTQAAREGLATVDELAKITGKAENSLRRWARERSNFPPEVGIAERIPPYQYGPPRALRVTADVLRWLLDGNVRLSDDERDDLAAELDALTDHRGSPGEVPRAPVAAHSA